MDSQHLPLGLGNSGVGSPGDQGCWKCRRASVCLSGEHGRFGFSVRGVHSDGEGSVLREPAFPVKLITPFVSVA